MCVYWMWYIDLSSSMVWERCMWSWNYAKADSRHQSHMDTSSGKCRGHFSFKWWYSRTFKKSWKLTREADMNYESLHDTTNQQFFHFQSNFLHSFFLTKAYAMPLTVANRVMTDSKMEIFHVRSVRHMKMTCIKMMDLFTYKHKPTQITEWNWQQNRNNYHHGYTLWI